MIRYSVLITLFAVESTADTAPVLKKYAYRLKKWLPPTKHLAKRNVVGTLAETPDWKMARVSITWRWCKNSRQHSMRRYEFYRSDFNG